MKYFTLVLVSVFGAVLPAYGSLLYSFTYTAQTGTVQSFSFSLLSPTFIGSGTPAFQPFTVTDGSTALTISQDLVGTSTGITLGSTFLPPGDGCFSFATSGADLAQFGGCGWAIPNNGVSQAAFTVDIPGGLPSAIGTSSNLIFDGITLLQPSGTEDGFYNCCGGQSSGAMQLTVSQVPEPPTFLPVVILAAGILVFRCGRHGWFQLVSFARRSLP